MSCSLRCLSILLIFSLLFVPFAESQGTDRTSERINRPGVKVKISGKKNSAKQQEDIEKLLAEGKRLYLEEMDNDGALTKFKQAETFAQTRTQKAEIYFFTSLIYYAQSRDIGNEEFDRAVRKLIEIDYYRGLDMQLCPPKYLELYGEIKKEYGVVHVQSSPPGAEVFVDNSSEAFGLTPLDIGHKEGDINLKLRKGKAEKSDTLRIRAGTETSSPVYKLRKRSSFLFITGGIALAAGVSAVLLFKKKEKPEPTGTIQVNSTPTGAEILLDDRNTGQITNSTLSNVAVGSHTVEVAREGYRNERRNVVVEEGQTTTVSVDLVKHTFTVTQPEADVIWVQGEQEEIKWVTGEETSAYRTFSSKPGLHPILNGEKRNFKHPLSASSPSLPGSSVREKKRKIHKSSDKNSAGYTDVSPFKFFDKTDTKMALKRMPVDSSFSRPKQQFINGSYRFSKGDVQTSGAVYVQALTNVKIQLYRGDSLVETITESTENRGSYFWTVSTSLEGGSDYRIKVSCVDEPSVADLSEEFMITHGYQFITKWGSQGTANGQFADPTAIAISGYVYVLERDNNRIQRFTSDGTFVSKWGSLGSGDGQFRGPRGIAADASGSIYVADFNNNRIQIFTSSGSFQRMFGSFFDGPQDMAFDTIGNVYITEQMGNFVQKYSSDGTFMLSWGGQGSGNDQFLVPGGIASDLSNNIYVADGGNVCIKKFTSNGAFLSKWGSFGSGDGQFNEVGDVDVDRTGFVYVVDSLNDCIQKFTSDGRFILAWGTGGTANGQFHYPTGIAVDESGNVYVCDSANHRIQKFGPNTTQTTKTK